MKAFNSGILLCVFSLLLGAGNAEAHPKSKYADSDCSDDTILVRFQPSVDKSTQDEKCYSLGAAKTKDFEALVPGLQVWRLPKGMTLDEALDQLKSDLDIDYAEVNHLHHAVQIVPNDPRFGDLWGLHNIGQALGTVDADIDGPEAWESTTGSNEVVVGVIDTGVDYNHEDLAANMWTNPGESPATVSTMTATATSTTFTESTPSTAAATRWTTMTTAPTCLEQSGQAGTTAWVWPA